MDELDWDEDPALRELVVLFLGDLQADLDRLEIARASAQVEQIAFIAHQIKGCAAGYGFPMISERAACLERQARGGGDFTSVVAELGEFVRACRIAMENR